jgi:hypothetical protein
MRIRNHVEEIDSAQPTRGEGGSDPNQHASDPNKHGNKDGNQDGNKHGNKHGKEVAKVAKEGNKDAAVLEQIKCGICLETLYKSETMVPCQHNF